MATLNLGRIKPVFQGAYNNSTAYVVDDIVTFGDETFICIQASTGNATSNASYWTKLAAKGTDGTDVGTTLTTQGDILYRDGSGLQRLPIGRANQILQVNSGANALEYTAKPEGGLVHILSQTASNVASIDFIHGTNGVVFDSTYRHYTIMISDFVIASDNNVFGVRFRQGGSFRNSNYDFATSGYEQSSGTHNAANVGENYGRLMVRNAGNQSNENFSCRIDIPNPSGNRQKSAYMLGGGRGGNGTVGWMVGATINTTDNAVMDGIQVIPSTGNITSAYISLYGMKSS